jgi:hypothetical protein
VEKLTKYIIIAVIGASCFSLLILYSYGVIPGFETNLFNNNSSTNDEDGITGRSTALSEVHNITLTVEYFPDTKKTWDNISLYNYDTSVLDALKEKCDVKTKEYSYGTLVIGIDSVEGDWIYYVNGKYAGVGAAAYYLDNGDEIYWKHVNV